MRKLLNSGNARLYLYAGILILIGLLWRAGNAVNAHLNELPIEAAPRVNNILPPLTEKNFYPVWVKQAVAQAPVADNSQVDALFKHVDKKISAQVKPQEPDYGAMFKQRVVIDGVANNGLFIGGHFYAVGEKLEPYFTTTLAGKILVPVLVSVNSDLAAFEFDQKKIVISVKGGS